MSGRDRKVKLSKTKLAGVWQRVLVRFCMAKPNLERGRYFVGGSIGFGMIGAGGEVLYSVFLLHALLSGIYACNISLYLFTFDASNRENTQRKVEFKTRRPKLEVEVPS